MIRGNRTAIENFIVEDFLKSFFKLCGSKICFTSLTRFG